MSEVKAKKASILTIEKELLSSYIEAITDMKLVKKELGKIEFSHELIPLIETLNAAISKHVDRIKSSGIWE